MIALSVILALVISACATTQTPQQAQPAPAPQQKVTLHVLDQFTAGALADGAAKEIYAEFSKKFPNIEIKRETLPVAEMHKVLKTMLASGTGPDVVYYEVGPGFAGPLITANLFAPLDAYADKYKWKDRQRLRLDHHERQALGRPHRD